MFCLVCHAAAGPACRGYPGTLNGSAIDSLATMIDPDPLPGSSCQNYDEEGRIRAAGLSAIALITAHPFGQTGDECMVGYFRKPVLAHGVLGTVLRCMQVSAKQQDERNLNKQKAKC